MQLIVPMAGLGQRFADAGHTAPKPLIDVSGLPMIARVVDDLPPVRRAVFVVHPEHVRKHRIDRELRKHFPAAAIVETPGLTAGQACTVRLAADVIDPDEDVLVAACDATHVYSAERFAALRADATIDAVVWTYRGEFRVLSTPRSFGWVRTDERGDVLAVSCKQPISDNLLRDPVVSGFFWFRSARRLMDAIDALVASGDRVNGEFYLDVVPNLLIATGARVVAFDVEKYIGWGTPEDLRDYQRWERYFATQSKTPNAARQAS